MPDPVTIPAGQLSINDGLNARAEEVLAAILQVFRSGTTGSTVPTGATLNPVQNSPSDRQALELTTAQQQLFFRQLAVAIVSALGKSTATPYGIPRANASGALDESWALGTVEGGSGSYTAPTIDASCGETDAVGDLVFVDATGYTVSKADPASFDSMPAVGVITEKPTSTTAVVQLHGPVAGLYTGLEIGKIYFVGLDGRPTRPPLSVDVGDSVFLQPIGVALDSEILMLSPSFNLAEVIG